MDTPEFAAVREKRRKSRRKVTRANTEKDSVDAQGQDQIFEFTDIDVDFSPEERELFFQAHESYDDLHEAFTAAGEDDMDLDGPRMLNNTRACAVAYADFCYQCADAEEDEGREEEASRSRMMGSMFELTASALLCPEDVLASEALLPWLQNHRLAASEDIIDEISEELAPEQSSRFWDLLNQSACRGQLLEAEALLSLHSKTRGLTTHSYSTLPKAKEEEAKLIVKVQKILEAFPLNQETPLDPQSAETFMSHWQEQIHFLLRSKSAALQENLEKFLRILVGDAETLAEVTKDWQDLLFAKLFYVQPWCPLSDLPALVEETVDEKRARRDPIALLTQKILTKDTRGLIKASSALASPWFTAHLADLLAVAQIHPIEILHPPSGLTDVEQFVLTFVNQLHSAGGFTELILNYLHTSCHNQGPNLIRQVISEMPIENEEEANLALETAAEYGFLERSVTLPIHRTMGNIHFEDRLFGPAFLWYLRASDFESLAQKTCLVLDELCSTSLLTLAPPPSSSSSSSSNPPTPALAELQAIVASLDKEEEEFFPRPNKIGLPHLKNLRFLKKFTLAATALHSGRPIESVESLIRTLSEKSAPRRFCLQLVKDAISLIKRYQVDLQKNQVETLMEAVESIRGSLDPQVRKGLDEPSQRVELESLILDLTLALAKSIRTRPAAERE